MGLSFWHILIVLMVVLIVFGAGKLPNVMGDLGKGIRAFKAGMNGTEAEEPTNAAPRLPPADKDETK